MGKYLIKKLNEDFKFIVDEQLVRGTRKKILSITNDKKLAMFKYEQYDCSESCSEKMAYEIALVLGYDCAKIDLACDDSGTLGVLNYYFVNNHDTFHTDIVAYLNKNSKDKKNYYTISNIKSVLDEIDNSLFNSFIKIIIFDALIGEQDRHEENWGILEKNGKYYVSPLYDNGDSLLKDFKNPIFADLYYSEKRSFDSYIRKSKTLIYKEMEKDKIIESLESRLADLDEERRKVMDRLIQLEDEELKEKFHVNDCFIDVISSGIYYYAYKVINVNADSILAVKVLRGHIMQTVVTSSGTTNWEKITSEQFDTLLKLGLDVIINPDDDPSFDREICTIKSNLKN